MILRIILFTVAFHMTFSVVRVTASLDALSHGYGSFKVGLLISLLALFPTFLSMPWGRIVDRVGARLPIAVGGLILLAGVMIPAVFPTSHFGLTPLAFSCALTGIGMMSTSMVSQQLMGFYSNSHNRTANFAWLATGQAASGLVTPILSGMIIDAFGHRYAFFYGTAAALLGLAAFYWSRNKLPASWERTRLRDKKTGAFELLSHPRVRNVLFVSALVSMAWDLEFFMFPVYGHAIGLSATEIGWLIGMFFAATFAVRFLMPLLSKRISEWQFLVAVLAIGSFAYILFPFFTELGPLLIVAFILGLGLGASQPNVMSLLQTQSPKGRVGEALGIRTMLTNLCHTVLPTGFGLLASAVGVFWIFIAMGVIMGGSAVLAQFRDRSDEVTEEEA